MMKYLGVPFHFTKKLGLMQQMERVSLELARANDMLLTAAKQESYTSFTEKLLVANNE
jgi:hypothetical protein